MHQEDAARVVLVRAVEETAPERIAADTLLEAHAAAGDPAEGEAWIVRRARYLVDHALGGFAPVLDQTRVALPGPWLSIGVAVVLGAASNYLGPRRHIHVVWNPIVLLIVWNLGAYAVRMATRGRRRPPSPPDAPPPPMRPARAADVPRPAPRASLAALVLGQPLPGREDAVRLLTEAGDPAARWIHLYAVSALLVIVVPRALLALAETRRLRRTTGDVRIDLGQPYFQDVLRRASAVSPEKLERSMRDAVDDECRRFADRLAAFVGEELYDRRIAPALRAFREEGGRLQDLEAALRQRSEEFGPVLVAELPEAERELERALVLRIQRLVGDESILATRPAGDLAGRVGDASSRAAAGIGTSVGDRIGTTVGGLVSASVAAAVGTVSGGFGEVLGIALLAELGLSGPVGWVVGAVAALVAAGAALWLGGERLREGFKSVPLPAAVLKVALWPGSYERTIAEGRQRCEAAVREALETQLEPLSSAIAGHIWRALKPVVGELQRPRVPVRDLEG